jgi:hypothetical protein
LIENGKDYKLRQKGVPKRYQMEFFKNGKVQIDHPNRFMESYLRKLPVNVWGKMEKRLVHGYSKRTILPTGVTIPKNADFLLDNSIENG